MLWYSDNVVIVQKERITHMADLLSISSIRERIFNPTKHEATVARSSNPFAQTSFKGNVLTADVFVSENDKSKENNGNKISFTGKLKASALVGSIAGIGNKIQQGLESVVAFANRIKDNVVNCWDKLSHTEITFEPAKQALSRMGERMNDALHTMFEPGISAKQISNMEDLSIPRQLLMDNVQAWEAAA